MVASWTATKISQLNVPDAVVKSNIANVESDVIELPVPRSTVWDIRADSKVKLFLYTKDVFNGTGAQVLFTMSGDMVDSPNLPAIVGDTVVLVGGVLQTSGYTVDYANNKITFGVAPPIGVGNVVVYYLFVPALVKIKVAGASREVSRERPLHTNNITSFHLNNQYATQTAVSIGNSWVLDEKQFLRLAVKSSVVVSADSVILPYQLLELDVLRTDRATLDQKDLAVVRQFAVTL